MVEREGTTGHREAVVRIFNVSGGLCFCFPLIFFFACLWSDFLWTNELLGNASSSREPRRGAVDEAVALSVAAVVFTVCVT